MSKLTPAWFVYHALCLNVGILALMTFRREIVAVIMQHKKRA